ncbi:MAG: DUF6456 domain-containing protein [Brevundimonas sp.]|uniref:DUF6456 domain-containing protein n=1 Tax=Brevundimonas sp. TaxID=1871086 RepID=UPI00273398D9|nr:DUF6456 domain-containing protein [Brevundimonas sp.]MDP3403771.1 DUF6456 domain-containing protein [Brevundimonas sp.]
MTGAVSRARALLSRSDGWIDAAGTSGLYPLRLGPDRRARIALTLDEAAVRALIEQPGLRARPGGGWILRPSQIEQPAPPAGMPGHIEGQRWVMEPDGRTTGHRANLGESPVAWLARRRDANGRPWLEAFEVTAAERLRLDAEQARAGSSLTMRWDALPRAGGGSAARVEPGDRALAAGRRVARALAACDPGARAFVRHICIDSQSLATAERACGLQRRQGKALLKRGLADLARHYGIG